MLDELPDLLQMEMHLIGLLGSVEVTADCVIGRTPSNPGFYHGNFLLLRAPPTRLTPWIRRFEDAFGLDVGHRCLKWVGGPLAPSLQPEAQALGLLPDGGVGLALDAPPTTPPVPNLDWSVRPLESIDEWPLIEQLNRDCDPAEVLGPEAYRVFKQRVRATIRTWLERDLATWWGGFDGERLVAQCGFVQRGDLGRYQAVETHPDSRRRGACAALIAHVAQDAFARRGCRRVLLEADTHGPAIGLYRRLGFVAEHPFHSLLRPSDSLEVHPESPGQQADVRTLLEAAFPTAAEARLVERLRGAPGALSLVAVQSGAVLGHMLFTPVRVERPEGTWRAMALAPLAVRPDRQGQGVGTALLRAGLAACRAAGHPVCFVLGDPGYYARAGFQAAFARDLTCDWPGTESAFQVVELEPDALAGRGGRVRYDPAFKDL